MKPETAAGPLKLIVIGGHTRNIGKTQLVCDIVAALPELRWVAGKITQFGHGICARHGQPCACDPGDHASAFEWETHNDTGTDTARFLQAGARRAFWLRTEQGHLAEGLPILRRGLAEAARESSEGSTGEGLTGGTLNVIVESNSLLQFLKPNLYLAVLDPAKPDFKESAQRVLDRANAYLVRRPPQADAAALYWLNIPERFLREKPSFAQGEGEPLPSLVRDLVQREVEAGAAVSI